MSQDQKTAAAATIDDVEVVFEVCKATNQGFTGVPDAVAAANGGLPTVNASNQVKVQGGVNKNTALAKFAFVMLDSVGNPATGLTVNCKRSIDGAAFANCNTATATEISNGFYYVDLAASDLNGNVIALRFSATGARDSDITLIPSA